MKSIGRSRRKENKRPQEHGRGSCAKIAGLWRLFPHILQKLTIPKSSFSAVGLQVLVERIRSLVTPQLLIGTHYSLLIT
ncbi:hypothetical protein WAI453_013145 [Rhynchosporium graminicola]